MQIPGWRRSFFLYRLYDIEIDTLKLELKQHGVEPSDIRKLNIQQSRLMNYEKQAVYLLYFKPNTVKLNELKLIRHLFHVIFRWNFYKHRDHDKLSQCRNCQMYGHSSVNCSMPTVCFVCAGDHNLDNCPNRMSRATLHHLRTSNQTVDSS